MSRIADRTWNPFTVASAETDRLSISRAVDDRDVMAAGTDLG
jgi:hypothetical protein